MAFALVLVLPLAIRGMVALIGAAYVTVIAVATVWAEWHRPSDTVAGAAAGARLGRPGHGGPRIGRLRAPGVAERRSRFATLLFLISGTITGAAGLLGLAAVALSER